MLTGGKDVRRPLAARGQHQHAVLGDCALDLLVLSCAVSAAVVYPQWRLTSIETRSCV